jgi:hypothetical protein
MNDRISIRLEQGDILATEADAVAVQYPQRLYGLVERVVKIFAAADRSVLLPQKDAVRLLEGVTGIAAPRILLVGVAPLGEYGYQDLQSFARRAIMDVAAIRGVSHIALPAYGPSGYRLDDAKSFEVEIEGIAEAARSAAVREAIQTVSIVEKDIERANRLWRLLSDGLVQRIHDKAHKPDKSRKLIATGPAEGRAPGEVLTAPTADHRLRRAIFLCYRREDTQDAAGRLYDRLTAAFGSDRVFMDIDSVPLGIDFVEHVREQISACAAVIVMIGKRWSTVKDRRRRRRLDDEDDLVRAEIRAALQQKIPVIPIVVQNAEMPTAGDLPDDIRPLARRNGIHLRPDQWKEGVERLLKELSKAMGEPH